MFSDACDELRESVANIPNRYIKCYRLNTQTFATVQRPAYTNKSQYTTEGFRSGCLVVQNFSEFSQKNVYTSHNIFRTLHVPASINGAWDHQHQGLAAYVDEGVKSRQTQLQNAGNTHELCLWTVWPPATLVIFLPFFPHITSAAARFS
jgi:hypothetical protein